MSWNYFIIFVYYYIQRVNKSGREKSKTGNTLFERNKTDFKEKIMFSENVESRVSKTATKLTWKL